MSMKPYKVGPQEPVQNLFSPSPWKELEDFKGGKGSVKKETNGEVRKFLSEEFGEKHKVIVMHPDNIVWLDDVQSGAQESFVDLFVAGPVILSEPGKGREIVEEGPDSTIAESMVETLHNALREEDGV